MPNNINDNIVLSSKVSLKRNIKSYPFEEKMSTAQKCELLTNMMQYISLRSRLLNSKLIYKDAALISENELARLIEKNILNEKNKENNEGVGVFFDKSENLSILINSDSHIEIKSNLWGDNLKDAYNKVVYYDDVICAELPLAFNDEYGYLFSDIYKCGTGFEASACLHLPCLEYTEELKSYAENMRMFGILIGNIRKSDSVYEIKNVLTAGISEEESIENLEKVIYTLVNGELSERNFLKNDEVMTNSIKEAVFLLKNAMSISYDEFLKCVSFVRIGLSIGLLSGIDKYELNKYTDSLSDAAIKESYKTEEVSERRAKLVKSIFEKVN